MNSRKLFRGGLFGLVALLLVTSTLFISSANNEAVNKTPQSLGQHSLATNSTTQQDPVTIAETHVRANLTSLGLTAGDIAEWVVSDQYATQHNGVTHVYFQQRLGGIRVLTGILNVNVAPSGNVINVGNRFVSHLAEVANAGAPQISAEQAVRAAAAHLGLAAPATPLAIEQLVGGAEQSVVFSGAQLGALAPIKARLQYLQVGQGARLVWDVQIRPNGHEYWHVEVDAVDSTVIRKFSLVDSDSYKVYEWPAESPNHVRALPLPPNDGRTIVSGSAANVLASPFGWHDTNGLAGADTADTTGNNVAAQTDETNDDVYVAAAGEVRPSDAGRNFIYPINLLQDADTYREAVVTNLFYWNNVIHDIHYLYGFNEAAGNFQQNNYGKGGQGNDRVDADAQDGSGTNNANMLTLPEGISPRMQMYIWTGATTLQVNSPPSIAGNYVAAAAAFGPEIDATGVTGDLQMVNSTVNPQGELPQQGCNPMAPGSLSGKVAVIDRGGCEFGRKVVLAEQAGAIAAIIINVQSDDPVLMGPGQVGDAAMIPSISIGNANGTIIKNAMATATVNATMKKSAPDRDSDLDNGVIIHEYGHGVSNRLTGGPSNVLCLENLEQGGEGWSDWWALALTARTGDKGTDQRGIGTYVTFQDPPTFGGGIRLFPYTTDMSVNPQTYGSVNDAGVTVPHGVGAIWAEMLWEMYWNIVDGVPGLELPGRGYRQNLYDLSQPLAGNQIAMQLVMDGLKLQPCMPTFIDARDAILEADRVNNGGAFQCHIWHAFAKRGLGVNAQDGGDFPLDDLNAVVEDFTLPCECNPAVAVNHALESAGGTVLASSTHASGNFPALAAINGDRTGATWGTASGGWNDGTRNAYPDVLEVHLLAAESINRINVVTLQNNWTTAGEPTLASPATGEGILDFIVQYCSANCATTPTWTTVTGGNVTGNDKAMRAFTFTPVTTSKLRVVVNNSRNNWSRIVEVEAFGCP